MDKWDRWMKSSMDINISVTHWEHRIKIAFIHFWCSHVKTPNTLFNPLLYQRSIFENCLKRLVIIAQIVLLTEISTYVGDRDVGSTLAISYQRSTTTVNFSWTNCTLLQEPCKSKAVEENIKYFVNTNNAAEILTQILVSKYVAISTNSLSK